MNFGKNFNLFTSGEYILSAISLSVLGIYFLFESNPKVFDKIPIVYIMLILVEVSIFFTLFILGYIIYYQNKKNHEFFQYDHIGSKYNVFRGTDQVYVFTFLFILILLGYLIIQYAFDNFLTSPYGGTNSLPNYYEQYVLIISILLLLYLMPYLLVLIYNVIITKYQGIIDKNHLGIPIKALITVSNLIIFGIITLFSILFLLIAYQFYFPVD